MAKKPTYEELEQRIKELENEVSDHEQAEEVLLESEEKYRSMLENMEEGYWEVDLPGNFTFFNDSLCKSFGYSRDELLGMNNRKYTTPKVAARIYRLFKQVYRTGQPIKIIDYEVIAKDGSKVILEGSVSLMRDNSGQPIGFRGVNRDVTERKRTEKALQESEEKYRTILESIEDGYSEVDLSGNFTFFNDAMCRIIGYSSDEMMGMDHREIVDKVNARKILEVSKEVYRMGKPVKAFDWTLFRKDGSRCFVETSVSLIKDVEGLPLGFRGISRDITQRKELEEALRESEKKYRSIFDSVTDALLIIDYNGNIVEANPQACEMYGYSPEEMIGLAGKNAVHPDYYYVFEELKKDVQEKGEFYAEAVHLRKDGSPISIEVRGGPFLYKGKQHLLMVDRDISDRKQAEEALRESKRNYQQQSKVLEGINRVFREALTCESEKEVADTCLSVAEELTGSKFGLIGEKNPEGRFDTIAISNPGWDACKMPDSDATRLIKDMEIRGIDRSTISEEKSRIVNDPASHPDRVGTPEGHPPITSFLGVPLKHGDKTIGMIGLGNKESGYDLSDQQAIEDLSVAFVEALMRKRAEEALRESEKRLRTVADFTYDWESWVGPDGKYIYVSPSCQRITEYSAEEFMKDPGLFTRIVILMTRRVSLCI